MSLPRFLIGLPCAKPGKPEPQGPSPEIVAAIVETKRRNPRFGYERIADHMALAFNTPDKDTVRRVLIERLIGTICRDYLDHVPYWNARDLRRKLSRVRDPCNRARAHQAIGGRFPEPEPDDATRNVASLKDDRWNSRCRGLENFRT